MVLFLINVLKLKFQNRMIFLSYLGKIKNEVELPSVRTQIVLRRYKPATFIFYRFGIDTGFLIVCIALIINLIVKSSMGVVVISSRDASPLTLFRS